MYRPHSFFLSASLLLMTGCQALTEPADLGEPTQLDAPPPAPQGSLTDDDAFAFIQGDTFGQETGRAVAVADFDGDGLADLAVGAAGSAQGDVVPDPGVHSGRVYIFSGPITDQIEELSQADTVLYGSEHFSEFGSAVAAGDLDGDGLADLVVGDGLSTFVFYGPIEEGLRPDTEAHAHIEALAPTNGRYQLGRGQQPLGDFDGDGDLDLPLFSWNDGFLFFDDPEGELSADDATGSLPADSSWNVRDKVTTGDLNGDGRDDLVAQTQGEGAYNYNLHVFFGPLDGERSFDASDAVIEGGELGRVARLDADSGRSDLVVLFRSAPHPVAWSLRSFTSPSGVLTEAQGEPLVVEGPTDTNPWFTLSSGDLNSDGHVDLLAGGRVFYGPFSEGRSAEAADVVLEDVLEGFSIITDDLSFDGADDIVCGQPGFMKFPIGDEERNFRPHGAVQLFAGGLD